MVQVPPLPVPLGPRDYVGWAIAVAGWLMISAGWIVSARIARTGWKKSQQTAIDAQHARKEIEDDARLDTIMDVLEEELAVTVRLLRLTILAMASGHCVAERSLRLLDAAREGYDRNRDHMGLIADAEARAMTIAWHRELRTTRVMLESFLEPLENPTEEQKAIFKTQHQSFVRALIVAEEGALDLNRKLGFKELPTAEEQVRRMIEVMKEEKDKRE